MVKVKKYWKADMEGEDSNVLKINDRTINYSRLKSGIFLISQ